MGKHFQIILGCAVAIDLLVWSFILFPAEAKNSELYFLPVGQGDSSLVNLAGGAQLLIDGGPINGKAQANLEKILGINDRYVDLVMISHPQLDHYGGLIEVLKNYEVGAVLTDGQTAESAAWQELEKVIRDKKIPQITLSTGDKIKYGDSVLDILSPQKGEWAKDVNDLSLVGILEVNGIKFLFGGDMSADKEKQLADLYDVNADILKVSHHGSKYSSNSDFLKEVSPAVSVIEVGKNSYGHPTKEALGRLANFSSQSYRTDLNGLVKIILENGKLKVYTETSS
ncbi:MAG: MBL fold metallo-hydrolase [bacterium]|nr:MBL fold metallo-hydrolase [bacterium]